MQDDDHSLDGSETLSPNRNLHQKPLIDLHCNHLLILLKGYIPLCKYIQSHKIIGPFHASQNKRQKLFTFTQKSRRSRLTYANKNQIHLLIFNTRQLTHSYLRSLSVFLDFGIELYSKFFWYLIVSNFHSNFVLQK